MAVNRRRLRAALALAAILALAFALRAVDLGREGFSPCEEGFNTILADGSPQEHTAGEIVAECLKSNQVPLPILLQAAWHRVVPRTIRSARFLWVVLGTLAVAAVYGMAAPLAGRRAALHAALLLACAASPILHARLVREYSLLLLLAALATGAWWKVRNANRDPRVHDPWRGFGGGAPMSLFLFEALGLHTHYAFAGLVAGFVFADFAAGRAGRSRLVIHLAAFATLVPWIAALALREGNPVFHLYRSAGSVYESHVGLSALAAPFWLFAVRDRADLPTETMILLALALAPLLYSAALRPRCRRLLGIAAVPFLLGALVFNALGRDDLLKARYFLPALPLVAAALGASAASARPAGRGLALVLAAAALSAASGIDHREADLEPRLCRDGFAAVAELARPGDLVIVEPPLIADYYIAWPPAGASPAPFAVRTVRQRLEFGAFTGQTVFSPVSTPEAVLAEAARAKRVVYFLYPYSDALAERNPLADRLAGEMTRMETRPVGGGSVTVYARPTASP